MAGGQGEIVGLTDARDDALANPAITATPLICNPARRYPAAWLTDITTQLAIVNANQPLATGGKAQAATAARDLALEILQTMNDRARFLYCSASDDEDQTPELAKIDKQSRRDRSEAEPESFPVSPGTATFNAATRTLRSPRCRATRPRCEPSESRRAARRNWLAPRQRLSSPSSPPSRSPLVTYESWLVGHSFRSDEPQSIM